MLSKNPLLRLALCCTALLLALSSTISSSAYALSKRSEAPQPLLFDFVSAKVGFETYITILNTSADSLGTTPHSGVCTLTYKEGSGGVAPGPATTTVIPAGGALTFPLSTGDLAHGVPAAGSFQGHIIADCSFPQARGILRIINTIGQPVGAESVELITPDSAQHPLLFPYVVNANGLDTGIAITNASGNFGVASKGGQCTLTYFGVNAPLTSVTTASIPAGHQVTFTLSNGGAVSSTPGFQGYIVANCDFPLARGFAFLSDLALQKFLSYEHAEILTTPRTPEIKDLLFSFTAAGSRDSTVVIANTGLDGLGTSGSSGKCDLDFYSLSGSNPPSETTNVIAPGTLIGISLQNGGGGISAHPSFVGYIFARCNFPYARGTSALQDSPLNLNLAELPSETVSLPRSKLNLPVLLPYVNTQGFRDTTITFTNTSAVPSIVPAPTNLGVAKGGSCAVEFHGNGTVPPAQTTINIDPGQTVTADLRGGGGSSGLVAAPNFEGYVVAKCNFPQARVYAVSDLSSGKDTYGIQGEVIDLDDSDNDGVLDIDEQCALDPAKTEPGACGCGIADSDSDADGVLDCHESCPLDPAKLTPGVCGCGQIDIDSNKNGAIDCLYGKDVQATYQQLSDSLKKLGFLKLTGNKKKDSARRLKLSQLRLSLKTLFDSINATLAAHTTDIQNSLPNIKFASLSLAANKSVKTALKMKRLTFSKDKKSALKNIAKLVKSLG